MKKEESQKPSLLRIINDWVTCLMTFFFIEGAHPSQRPTTDIANCPYCMDFSVVSTSRAL